MVKAPLIFCCFIDRMAEYTKFSTINILIAVYSSWLSIFTSSYCRRELTSQELKEFCTEECELENIPDLCFSVWLSGVYTVRFHFQDRLAEDSEVLLTYEFRILPFINS